MKNLIITLYIPNNFKNANSEIFRDILLPPHFANTKIDYFFMILRKFKKFSDCRHAEKSLDNPSQTTEILLGDNHFFQPLTLLESGVRGMG